MATFVPNSWTFIWQICLAYFIILFVGYFLVLIKNIVMARWSAWLWVILSFIAGLALSWNQAPGLRMLSICGALLYGMKIVILSESRRLSGLRLRALPYLYFCTLWFGMNPEIFQKIGDPALPKAGALFRKGLARFALGLTLVAMARFLGIHHGSRWLVTLLILPGISLIFHFGLFNILAGFWQYFGVPADSLFKAPLISKSLNEFWGKRWNLAFSDMARLSVYQPLTPKLGRNLAALVAFLFSGLLHELAISVPVRAGYGLPFSYFIIHGILLQIEKSWSKKNHPIDQNPTRGHVWTLLWLVLPMLLLFHPYFLRGILWPLAGVK